MGNVIRYCYRVVRGAGVWREKVQTLLQSLMIGIEEVLSRCNCREEGRFDLGPWKSTRL